MSEDVAKYQKITHVQHILQRPDTYIGSIENDQREMYIYNDAVNRFTKKLVTYNDGFMRVHFEILYNAIDNISRSYERGLSCDLIEMCINDTGTEMSVKNNGLSIPVTQNENGEYIPEFIFGCLMSGSNFDDTVDRYTTGRNGLGAKLTNVFSKHFYIEINDPENKLLYKQQWKDNMYTREAPSITESKIKCGYVKISWEPDFVYFGMERRYTEDQILLLKKIAYDIAGNSTKCTVKFNDVKIKFNAFLDYCKLYGNEVDKEYINIKTKIIDSIGDYESNVVISASYERSDTTNVSFVNNLCTCDNGKHYTLWSEKLLTEICQKLSKKNKVKVETRNIKKFFNLFVSCKIINPTFKSQSKNQLTGSKNILDLSVDILPAVNKIMTWGVIDDIRTYIDNLNDNLLKKTTKTRKKSLYIDNYDSANKAGTINSKYCSLLLCEGLSAKTYAVVGMSHILTYMNSVGYTANDLGEKNDAGIKGRDWLGIYPLRGVPINSRNATNDQILKNKEVMDIMAILNIEKNTDYTLPENICKLTYGRVIILTDADVDGIRIKGLLLNIFHNMFNSLLTLSFIVCMKTPILKLSTARHNSILFYNETLARRYIEIYDKDVKSIKYYKGLGTSNNEDIKQSFAQFIETIAYDNKTDDMMDIMFNKKKIYSDARKELVTHYDHSLNESLLLQVNHKVSTSSNEVLHVITDKVVQLSEFLKNDMVEFSIANCKRTIPSIMDGLKQSQRKILYGLFKKNVSYTGKSIKVAQLCGYVSEVTNYHHGEQNLGETIIKLAHSFTGTNNLPILYADGQFGCLSGGTHVLLWGGSIKTAKDININDKLVGDDGCVRTIHKLISGSDHMYEITQTMCNGDRNNYTVNGSHILTLKCTMHNKMVWSAKNNEWVYMYFDIKSLELRSLHITHRRDVCTESPYDTPDSDLFDIKLSDYLKISPETRLTLKGVQCSVCLKMKTRAVPLDPYILGLLLCSKLRNNNFIRAGDIGFSENWVAEDVLNNVLTFHITYNKTISLDLNSVNDALSTIGLCGSRFIPRLYVNNSSCVRMQMLIAFIDIRGSLCCDNSAYCINLPNTIEDVKISHVLRDIANSLGIVANIEITHQASTVTLYIYGHKLRDLHIKSDLKILNDSIIDPFICDISVTYIGVDKFYGWTIDGNNRFLLSDYTITHNSRIALGGDAASPRYIFTKLNKYTRMLFNANDDNVLTHIVDDGDAVEPEFYAPILPLIVINGCRGIGTGFSTNIINFNTKSIINYITHWLVHDTFNASIIIKPWYKDFLGDIVQISDTKWECIGLYKYDSKNNSIHISEIPVTISITDFKNSLDLLIANKKIHSYNNYSTENVPNFIIRVYQSFGGGVIELIPKLKSALTLSNMTLFDVNGDLVKYDSVYDIIIYYCNVRLEYYGKRKEKIIEALKRDILFISNKHRFIHHVIEDNSLIFKKTNKIIIEVLDELKYDRVDGAFDYLLNITVKSFDAEHLDKLSKLLNNKRDELELLKNKSIKNIWLDDLNELNNSLNNDNYFN